MIQFKCPHCDQQCISFWKKMSLGPGVLATCQSCDKQVSVSNKAMLAIVPMLFAIVIGQEADSVIVEASIFALGFLVSLAVHIKMTPLVAR